MFLRRPRSLAAMCPPCVRFDGALATCPQFVRRACVPWVRRASALRLPPNLVCHRCYPCDRLSPPPVFLVSAPCVSTRPAVGQGRSIMKQRFFSALRVFIGQFPWHSFWLHKLRVLQARLMLEKLFGVYAGIFPWIST